jgi:DNA-binding CsgD family transcriptional regulator
MDAAPGFAYLGVLRDKREDPPFDAKARAIMQFLQPAFRAGIHTYLRLATDRALLGSLLDAGGKRLLLCDLAGKPIHASSALERTLVADPERRAIERNMERLARSTAELRSNGNGGVRALAESGERTIATVRGRYRLSASLAGETGPKPVGVLVLVEPQFREPIPDDELRSRFHLTGQELRIARLIGEGLRNHEVARRLGISPHTARRHTEHVLDKLGIASRVQIAERLSRD